MKKTPASAGVFFALMTGLNAHDGAEGLGRPPGHLYLCPVLQGYEETAIEPWLDIADPLEVDHLLPVGPEEIPGGQSLLKVIEGAADQRFVVLEENADVIVL